MYHSIHSVALWRRATVQVLDMYKIFIKAVHSAALWTRVSLQVWTCVKSQCFACYMNATLFSYHRTLYKLSPSKWNRFVMYHLVISPTYSAFQEQNRWVGHSGFQALKIIVDKQKKRRHLLSGIKWVLAKTSKVFPKSWRILSFDKKNIINVMFQRLNMFLLLLRMIQIMSFQRFFREGHDKVPWHSLLGK